MEEYLTKLGFMSADNSKEEKKKAGDDGIQQGISIAHAREEFPAIKILKGKSCSKKSCTSELRSKRLKKRRKPTKS